MGLRAAATTALLLLSLAGCASGGGTEAATGLPTTRAPGQATPTSAPAPAPGGPPAACTEEAVRETVEGALAAYGEGAPDVVADRFVASGGRFGWFGDPERPYPQHPDSDRRETIAGYVALRHALGERLVLERLTFYRYKPAEGVADFTYVLVRSGSVPQPTKAIGKGALDCRSGEIAIRLVGRW